MDTDLLQKLAVHPNIAGIKHTDHNLGKIARLSSLKDTFGSESSAMRFFCMEQRGAPKETMAVS